MGLAGGVEQHLVSEHWGSLEWECLSLDCKDMEVDAFTQVCRVNRGGLGYLFEGEASLKGV